MAAHHAQLWDWAWSIDAGQPSRPFIQILARGGGKSSSAEMVSAAWGARDQRQYGWYVSETQPQADDHVGNVSALLESPAFSTDYPSLAEKRTNKFGDQRAWRRNRIWTASGFVLDALGLDTASRGIKLEEHRPDFMIFDDLDRGTDGAEIVAKKIAILTRSILPAGTDDLAVLGIQNLIHQDGIFARLAGVSTEPADFLADRIVSGPHPALRDAAYEQIDNRWYVVAGTPTWLGQDLAACQRIVARDGLSSFRAECQHEVEAVEGGLFSDVAFRHCSPEEVPDLVATTVWVDPAVSETNKSDSHGIQADGLASDGTIYRLYSWEGITSPLDSIRRAIQVAVCLGSQSVGIETDQGGDTWWSVYHEATQSLLADGTLPAGQKLPAYAAEKAGRGHGPKAERASRQLADYELGRIVHVLDEAGSYAVLERALRRFPIRTPFDLVDASYWSWHDLRGRNLAHIGTRPIVRGVARRGLAERFAARQERLTTAAALRQPDGRPAVPNPLAGRR
jgi:hypothetical protein